MLVEELRKSGKMSDFVTLRVLSLVLAFSVLSALPACTRPEAEDVTISAAASKIAFDGEPLGLSYRWTKEAALDIGWAELPAEVQHWSAAGATLVIYGIQTVNGAWLAKELLPVRQTLVNVQATNEEFLTGEIAWGSGGDLYTKLDRGKYLRFLHDDEFCFSASILYENTKSLNQSDHFLFLIFCQTQKISNELLMTVVLSVRYKGSIGSDVAATSARAVGAGSSREMDAAATANDAVQVPLTLIWRDRSESVTGALTVNGTKKSGMLESTIFGTSDKCSGSWQWVSGSYGTVDPPKGTWSVVCTDGRAASGTYTSDTPASGDGRGTDGDGNTVIIAFGQGAN